MRPISTAPRFGGFNSGGNDNEESGGEEHKVGGHGLANLEFDVGLVEFKGFDVGLSFFNSTFLVELEL
ncbi:hypothetical protein ACFX2C_019038 [Malus domestica]